MKPQQIKDPRFWLETATTWRFLSLVFQSPNQRIREEMRALARELPIERRTLALELASHDHHEAEYHRVLGPAGIPACESSYDDNALAGRGPVLARIAGFYEAFAFKPAEARGEVPDHISVELGFLSYLAVKIAYAIYEQRPEEAEVALSAYDRFLGEHLCYWAPKFHDMLQGTGSQIYVPAASWLSEQAGIRVASPRESLPILHPA